MAFADVFNAVSGLGKSYWDGLDSYENKQGLRSLGDLASGGDYTAAARAGFAIGKPELGLGLLQLGREAQAASEFGRLMGGGGAAPAPAGAPAPPAAPAMAGGGQSMRLPADPAIRSKFIETVKAGGLTNPVALAVVDAYGQAESGWNPGNVARTWSDPSQSGQPGTSGGLFSWRGPRLAAMQAATVGADDPVAAQAKFFLTENPEVTVALQNAKSIEEAHQILADAWRFAGYDQPGQGEHRKRYNMARLLSRRYAGDPGAAAPAAQAEAPTQTAQADMPAEGSREVQFNIPGDPSRIPLPANIAARMNQLRQAAAIPGLPAAQRQAAHAELSQLQQEAQQYRSSEYTRLRDQERDQRREQREDERAIGGSQTTRDFVIARRNGWTKARTPAEYAADQQASNAALFDGKSVEGQALNYLVQNGQLTKEQAAQFGAGKTITIGDTAYFMTPEGIFGKKPDGTVAQEVPFGKPAPLGSGTGAPAPTSPAAQTQPQPGRAARPGMVPLGPPKVGNVPTEVAARIGLGNQFVDKELPWIRQQIDQGTLSGVGSSVAMALNAGTSGEIARRTQSGVDALLRGLTGAGMGENEAVRYAKRYEITPIDPVSRVKSKLDGLEADLIAVRDAVLSGKNINDPALGGIVRESRRNADLQSKTPPSRADLEAEARRRGLLR
jgi:hypothetical protein